MTLDKDLRHRIFQENLRGNGFYSFDLQENAKEYYNIYYDYLLNLTLSLINYEGMPKTFNTFGFEYLLRYVGWGGITAIDKDHVYVSSMSGGLPSTNLSLGGLYGPLDNSDSSNRMVNKLSGKKILSLNLQNMVDVPDGTPVRVTVGNKPEAYAWAMNAQQLADTNLISKTAYALGYIRASILQVIGQMRTSWVGITNNGNQTAKQIFEQIDSGQPFIQVDKSVVNDDDLSKILKIFPAQVDSTKLAQMQDQWNNIMNDFLTQIGIQNVSINKRERLTYTESTANSQQVSYGIDVYLKARQMGLDMLNEALGTNMSVTINNHIVSELINFSKTGTGTITGGSKSSDGGDDDAEQDNDSGSSD